MYDKNATLLRPPATFVSEVDGLLRRKWTVEECRFLVKNGLLEDGKFELLDGEIVYKMSQSIEHGACVTGIIITVSSAFDPFCVQSQRDIQIGDDDEYSNPEPDVAVLRKRVKDYVGIGIDPRKDVVLVAEASLTTLSADKTRKRRIYGRQGIPEYWIVDIELRQLIVHRAPDTENGGYADVRTYSETDTFSPLEKPDALVRVADLLP